MMVNILIKIIERENKYPSPSKLNTFFVSISMNQNERTHNEGERAGEGSVVAMVDGIEWNEMMT